MAKKPIIPEIQVKQFTAEEILKGIEKLKRRIDQVRSLDPMQIAYDDQRIDNIEFQIRDTIRDVFGLSSPEFKAHQYHSIWKGGHLIGDSPANKQKKFADGIPKTILMLEGLISHLEEKLLDFETTSPIKEMPTVTDNERVFIVHGRNEATREKVARFIEKLDLTPIILHEQPNSGQTIIEKFEKNADVGFAIILLTSDDIGCLKTEFNKDITSVKERARQNVVFELGYFVGRLGRARVCALYESGVELPSDIHGVLYISFDDNGGWQLQLSRELKVVGYDIDLNKAV